MRNNFETEAVFNHLEVDVEKGIFKLDGRIHYKLVKIEKVNVFEADLTD